MISLASTKYMGIAESGELSTSTGDPIQWAESGLKLGYNPLIQNTLTKQFQFQFQFHDDYHINIHCILTFNGFLLHSHAELPK